MNNAIPALFAAVFMASCAGRPPLEAPLAIPIPPLDSHAATPCPDITISANPKIAVVEHRRALADCETRRAVAVGSYNLLRDEFGLRQ
jgi:hypothetical protein